MDGIYLGVDLCNDYCQLSCYNDQKMEAEGMPFADGQVLIPTVLCKSNDGKTWHFGQEAFEIALAGGGVLVDQLVQMALEKEAVRIEAQVLNGYDLLQIYLQLLFLYFFPDESHYSGIRMVFTVQTLDPDLMDHLIKRVTELGFSRENVAVISHTESMLYYVVSQKKELWNNLVCLFDWSQECLYSYEFKVTRGRKQPLVEVGRQLLEETFPLELLHTESGKKMANNTVSAHAGKILERKLVSSIFLTGKGFESTDWAEDLLPLLCRNRRVFAGQNLFAKGAAYVAVDRSREETAYPYLCICEGRLKSTVFVEAIHEGGPCQLVLARAGKNWYEEKTCVRFILDTADTLTLYIERLGSPRPETAEISLAAFPQRPPNTTQVDVVAAFIREDCMMVRIIDQGFGDWYPTSGIEVKEYLTI